MHVYQFFRMYLLQMLGLRLTKVVREYVKEIFCVFDGLCNVDMIVLVLVSVGSPVDIGEIFVVNPNLPRLSIFLDL